MFPLSQHLITMSRTAQLAEYSYAMQNLAHKNGRKRLLSIMSNRIPELLLYHKKAFMLSYNMVHDESPGSILENLPMAWKPKEFITMNLLAEHRTALSEFSAAYDNNGLGAAEQLLGIGYKMSITWSDSSMAFIATVIGTENTPKNESKSMSSFSDDLNEALLMSAFKVLVLANGDEWTSDGGGSRWG